MKRSIAALLCILLCLSAGCSSQSAPARPKAIQSEETMTTEPAPGEIASAVAESQGETGGMTQLSGDILTGYLSSIGLEEWQGGAVWTGEGMDAREITVVKLADETAAEAAAQLLEEHRQARIRDFFGYAPEEAELLERAQVLVQGNYAAFLACVDGDAAREAFSACFEGGVVEVHQTLEPEPTPEPVVTPEVTPQPESTPEPEVTAEPAPETTPTELNPGLDVSGFPPYQQPNDVDMTLYDNTAVVAAWRTGDESGLSDKDRAILARCREAFAQVVTEDMTDFEKELALHDWLLANGEYDAMSRDNVAHIGQPNNTDPYGMLVGGYGICLGFSTTFQLFMELAGIECITVVGAAYKSTADHAWNMVRLDGEWYCVDVTWDNSYEDLGGSAKATHKYFNVTSERLRQADHQWDYRNTPEATATHYRWDGA